MTFLPIVERELRVAARKRGTFWLRVVAALVALAIGGSVMLLALTPFSGRMLMGGPIFATLTWLSLAGALSAGLFFTSDCLSEEKREGTLGFLFLTDLRGYDVVLGKLLATSLRCVFALLAIFPVLAITLLMGGVEAGQFWRTLLALSHALFFSLSVGLFVSALSRQSQKALAGTVLLLILFVGLGPVVDGLNALVGGTSLPMLSLASPGYVFTVAAHSPTYWPAFLVSQGVAWSLLALACVLLPRTWQEKPERTSAKVLSRRYAWQYGGAKGRAVLREKLLGKNPVMWLAARERGQAFWLWVVTLMMLMFFFTLIITGASGGWWQAWSLVNSGFWIILYLWAAAKACQFFAEARRNGMIELLLASPLTAQETVQGPWRALVRMFAVPVLLLLGMQLVANLLSRSAAGGGLYGLAGGMGWSPVFFAAAAGVVVGFANLVALGWFGLWMGLVSKNARMATLKTILFVTVIPWFAIIFLTTLAIPIAMLLLNGVVDNTGTASSQLWTNFWFPFLLMALPAGLALAKDVFFWKLARRKLTQGFREVAVRAVIPIQASVLPSMTFPQTMTLLPIVERELRVAARKSSMFWLRLLLAFAVIVVATWTFLVVQNEPPRELGKIIFCALTGGLMFYCLLAGVRATADCLSEEKREGTLGLLFLTDLRGYDVIFGKLAANSLGVFYGVLAVVPVLAIPLLMGGVSGGEYWRVALVLVNTLFFSLSAGMLASALCQNQRAAIGLTILLIMSVAAGGPALGLWWAWLQDWRSSYNFAFVVSSPVFSYFAAFDKVRPVLPSGVSNGYYWSVGIGQALGWAFLALASWIAPRSWQDKPVSGGGWRGRVRAWFEGDSAARLEFRAQLLDQNAFFWLATCPRRRVVWAWMPFVLAAGIWGWGLYELGHEWLNVGIYAATAFFLSATMKAWIGAEAGRRLTEDRKNGALELLLSTPLSVRDILRGQRLALERQFLGPVLVLLVASGLLLWAGAVSSDLNHIERPIWFWTWAAGFVMLGADVVTLYWLGLWTGLAVRNSKHAFGAAIVPVLVLPWIAMALAATVINLLPRELRQMFDGDGWPVFLWFGFGIMADVSFGFWARHKLLTEFRILAVQRYQPKPSWWRRLFGKSSGQEIA